MRFMGLVKMKEGQDPAPPALMDAMEAYVAENATAGVFVDGGGLHGIENAVNFVVRDGRTTRVDGPYAEAKEVAGGWALLESPTIEDAIASQQKMADLHAEHWPEAEVVITLRQISEGPAEG